MGSSDSLRKKKEITIRKTVGGRLQSDGFHQSGIITAMAHIFGVRWESTVIRPGLRRQSVARP
jgi:hypothetical protein